jgi:hypothetical protein
MDMYSAIHRRGVKKSAPIFPAQSQWIRRFGMIPVQIISENLLTLGSTARTTTLKI